MVLASVESAVVNGFDGQQVMVEAYTSSGLPQVLVVGLPDAACREARERVRAAITSSGFVWPSNRVVVNLSPSTIKKEGACLDLAMAMAVLASSEQIPHRALEGAAAVGELGLDGTIKEVSGLICLASSIVGKRLYVPIARARQATLAYDGDVLPVADLRSLVAMLLGNKEPTKVIDSGSDFAVESPRAELADVSDQPLARWALEISAAGGHHMLMVGPPGAGKTMLASRLPGLLPDLSAEDSLTVSKVHSAAGISELDSGLIGRPPFRAPHHGATMVGILGGGTGMLRPGEISNAHGGVLFLDELGEYSPDVIDSLRTPLEQGVIRISRAMRSVEFPARFLLVAAMNPCPCGRSGSVGKCVCNPNARRRYLKRLSGPILDRFDLRIEVQPPQASALFTSKKGETTEEVARRVAKVRNKASERGVVANSALSGDGLELYAPLSDEAIELLSDAVSDGRLSPRGVTRVRTVALTIADLDDRDGPLDVKCVGAAMSLRSSFDSMFQGVFR